MKKEARYLITSYDVTMYSSKGGGWIRLKNEDSTVGYIKFLRFFRESSGNGGFGGSSEKPYVIMGQPIENWPVIIDLLRNESPLYIRGFQASGSSSVSVFFGTSADEPVGEGEIMLDEILYD